MFHVYETIIKKLHCLKLKSFLKAKTPGISAGGLVALKPDHANILIQNLKPPKPKTNLSFKFFDTKSNLN